jgi:CRISPR/Cas system-associated exonuclease Cas4 (RecB family)
LLLRFEPDAPAPDPLFPAGWDAALREELATPGWALHQAEARGLGEGFAAHTAAVQQMLFDLPAISPATTDPLVATSVTGLVTYAHCPQRFFWSEVERLPRRPNPAARAGTRVHRQIELHQRGHIPLDDFGPDLYDGDGYSVSGEDPAVSGVAGPFQMFTGSRFAQARARMIETPFEMVLSGVRLRGRIDAVFEPEPRHWEIVDFKSGRPRSEPSGHVQLEAYAVAAETGALGPPPDRMTVTFAFLGGGLKEHSETVDDHWLASARDRLADLAQGITAGRYEPKPGAGCHGCDFLRFCPTGRAHVAASK